MKQLNPEQLEVYKSFLVEQRGLRPSTVNRRLSALSAFARFLVSRGRLAGNPLDLVSRVGKKKVSKVELRFTWEGVQQIRTEVHKDVLNVRERAAVELLYAGLTVRELCSLKYDGQWTADKNYIKMGERIVNLHARACLALEHYMILRPILCGDYLFAGKGEEWSLKPSMVYWMVRRLARRCGTRIGVKDLRLACYAARVFRFEDEVISSPIAA